ncbi:hypothetical protein HD554DRAFT_2040188 [Boletus coccyginus]|nr:hypothetical protein HD554DRAFT_2040188 [Boletus coccyginus]
MPRLRGPIRPQAEKQRKKGLFSKFRKRNLKDPGVTVGVGGHGSPVYRAILSDSWRQDQYQSKDTIILKLTNMLGAVYMMGGRVYTVTSRWDVFSVGTGGKQTYFTPAPWSFFMWPVIHSLMLGGCIYQFSHQGSNVLIDQPSSGSSSLIWW